MTMGDISTPDEVLEAELAIIQAAGVKVRHVGYQRDGKGGGVHLYDVIEPQLPGFPKGGRALGYPTRTLEGLREVGLIK